MGVRAGLSRVFVGYGSDNTRIQKYVKNCPMAGYLRTTKGQHCAAARNCPMAGASKNDRRAGLRCCVCRVTKSELVRTEVGPLTRSFLNWRVTELKPSEDGSPHPQVRLLVSYVDATKRPQFSESLRRGKVWGWSCLSSFTSPLSTKHQPWKCSKPT